MADPMTDLLLLVAGGAVGGGTIQGVGAWYLRTRLQKVDRIDRRLDRLIQYLRITNPAFEKLWQDNGGERGD